MSAKGVYGYSPIHSAIIMDRLSINAFSHAVNSCTFTCVNPCITKLTTVLHSDFPASGHLITFSQFLLVSLLSARYFFSLSLRRGLHRTAPFAVPLRRWLVMVALFLSLSLLNNRAFAYRIDVPLHIVFRSLGLIVGMILGYFVAGKRYVYSVAQQNLEKRSACVY